MNIFELNLKIFFYFSLRLVLLRFCEFVWFKLLYIIGFVLLSILLFFDFMFLMLLLKYMGDFFFDIVY